MPRLLEASTRGDRVPSRPFVARRPGPVVAADWSAGQRLGDGIAGSASASLRGELERPLAAQCGPNDVAAGSYLIRPVHQGLILFGVGFFASRVLEVGRLLLFHLLVRTRFLWLAVSSV